MKNVEVGVVIVAAGMSSRMQDFKPLMKIGNLTMIEMVINNFELLGVNEIVVVTGYRAYDIKKALKAKNIKFIHNDNYETTHMFDSICLGLKEIESLVGLAFITPADSPFVQQFTLKRMIDMIQNKSYNLIQPSYDGNNGHPLMVKTAYVNKIIKHDGTNGMQGAIANMNENYINVSFADPGIVLDADTAQDFEKLLEYNKNICCPSIELCRKIQDYFIISDLIKSHSDKVAEVALDICQKLSDKGIILDKKVVVAASMLHDIAKGNSHHAEVGANYLLEMGYEEVSNIVKEHMELNEVSDIISEKEVVYLADKLVIEGKITTIEQRFLHKEEVYKFNKKARDAVNKRKKQALFLYNIILGGYYVKEI